MTLTGDTKAMREFVTGIHILLSIMGLASRIAKIVDLRLAVSRQLVDWVWDRAVAQANASVDSVSIILVFHLRNYWTV